MEALGWSYDDFPDKFEDDEETVDEWEEYLNQPKELTARGIILTFVWPL